jgi:helix-turn-helix protein
MDNNENLIRLGQYLSAKGISNIEQAETLFEPGYYAIIPLSILENKNLSANSKLLYAEIVAISKKSGECYATNRYLGERLGLSENSIYSLTKVLVENNLISVKITKNKKGTFRTITFNESRPKQMRVGGIDIDDTEDPKKSTGGSKEVLQKRYYTKDNINTDSQKESDKPVFTTQGADLIKAFEVINPACKKYYGHKTQRAACDELIKEFGFERVKTVIQKTLPKTNAIEYFPTITTPSQLLDKWASLEAQVKKHQSKIKNDNSKIGHIYA